MAYFWVQVREGNKQSCPDPCATASSEHPLVCLKGQCTPPRLPALVGLCMPAEAETHLCLFQAYPQKDLTAALDEASLLDEKRKTITMVTSQDNTFTP